MYAQQIGTEESPSIAVIRTISAFSNTPEEKLDPLFDIIDPEAMDAIIGTSADGSISFRYSGFDVTVAKGQVILNDDDEPQSGLSDRTAGEESHPRK